MTTEFKQRQLPYRNPLANALVVVVGAIAIVLSFVIGFVALFAFAAAIMVLGAVIAIRLWWLNFKARRNAGSAASKAGNGQKADATLIEGEFEVISNQKDPDGPPET